MPTAKQVINSIKPNLTKAPQGQTQKGSAGYDNIREDIEKTKSLREGSIEKVPVNNNDIVNKLALDTAIGGIPAGGDVTAGANLTDETLVQGDGGAKGVKTSTATVAQVASAVSHYGDATGADHSDVVTAVGLNTAKDTNVTTNLSLGAGNATTEVVACSDGTDCTLIEADTDNAGLLGANKWDEIVANTSAKHTQGTDTALGAQAENLDMNTHKIVGVVDPTANQEAATKKYVDDNAGGGAKEMFLYPMDTEWSTELGGHGIALLSSSAETHFAFRVPPDYTSMTTLGVICLPDTTETLQWDVTISKTALGGNHSDSIALNETQAVTLNQCASLDIKATFDLDSPSVGDFIGIHFKSDTTSIRVLGCLVVYS